MSDLQRAKELLKSENYTLVLVCGKEIFSSELRGIRPLLELVEAEKCVNGWSAADRIVGKAAAMLYACLGVKEVYAEGLSRTALEVLVEHGIKVEHETLAEKILNRAGDGLCPMERAVEKLVSPHDAPAVLRKTLDAMMNNKI